MAIYKTANADETEKIGRALGEILPEGRAVALFGDLGAGKTVFVKGFAKGFGVEDEAYSPTFALVNEYRGKGRILYHFDMYRVSGWDDLCSTGYFDFLDSGNSLIIEWSENIEAALPDDCVRVKITEADAPDERNIEIIGVEKLEAFGD